MTMHPDEAATVHKWKQAEIVLWILEEHAPLRFTVDDLIEHMVALGYPARKRKRATLQAVLSRLAARGKISVARDRAEYYAVNRCSR